MSERKQIDWETIESEYRTGQFSDAELSRRHGCSRTAIQKKSQKLGWAKDLTQAVRQSANAKLIAVDAKVAGEVAGCNAKSATDAAADRRVNVVLSHRQDINRLRDLEERFLSELIDNPTKLYITQYQGEIVEKEVGIAVTDKCAALNNLANVQHKRIAMERQAFNIDDGAGNKPSGISDALPDAIREMLKERPVAE